MSLSDIPGVDPIELGKMLGVDITNMDDRKKSATNGAASQDRESFDLSAYPAVQEAIDNPVLKDDGVTVDRSDSTFKVAAACVEARLGLEQVRWAVDQSDDLRGRLGERHDDDVLRAFERATERSAWLLSAMAQQAAGAQQTTTPSAGPTTSAGSTSAGPQATGKPPTPGGLYDLTDARIGAHIADTCLRGRFLVTKELGWMEYDGKRWASTADPVVGEAIRQAVINLYVAEVVAGAGTDRLKAISALFSASRIFALVRIAKGVLWVNTAEFDAHPDLFNANNGVVNLRDGSIGPHDPALLFTKLCPTNYIPGATHADWIKALAALPDDEVRVWLQIRFGQGLTGYPTPDDVLVFLNGDGENGKSTVVIAIQRSTGLDYCVTLPDRVLLANNTDHPTELMTLRGARLAFMEELPDQHLNIKRLKDTHGKGSLSARYCGKDTVAWEPTHSIFVTTNHRPQINEPEHAVWRRLAMVVFPFRYRKKHEPIEGPNDHRGDPGLRERIRLGRQGRHEAVLAWLIEGAKQWYQNGQEMPQPPTAVEAAKEAWRTDADVLLRFARDELVPAGIGPTDNDNVLSTELYQHFADWLKTNGHSPWSDQLFSARFEQHARIKVRNITKGRLFGTTHAKTLSRRPLWSTTVGTSYAPGPVPSRYSAWLGVRFRLANDNFDAYGPKGW